LKEANELISSIETSFDSAKRYDSFDKIEKVNPIHVPDKTLYRLEIDVKNPLNLNSSIMSYF